MPKITEIVPDDIPAWAKKSFHEGQFFNAACKAMNALEEIKDQLEIVRRIAERGMAQALNQKGDVDIWQHLLDELKRAKNALTEVVE